MHQQYAYSVYDVVMKEIKTSKMQNKIFGTRDKIVSSSHSLIEIFYDVFLS